jgi:tetratricopeptide (TPR) repeat protein
LERFYAHSKQTTHALRTIEKLLQQDPGNVEVLIDQASIHFNAGDYDRTLASLDRILKKDSKNLSALLYRVIVFKETKNYTNALAEVERVLDFDADNYEGLLQKGALLIETKAFEEAIKPLTRLLELRPNDLNGLRNRAIANLQRDRLDDAQRDYEKLQRNAPRYHIPYFGLAEIAYRRKDTVAAIRNYEYYLKYAGEPKEGSDLATEKKMVTDRLTELRSAGGR